MAGAGAGAARRALSGHRTLAEDILTACGVASFWRGAWYVADAVVYPESPAKSGAACLGGGAAALAGLQVGARRALAPGRQPPGRATRYAATYALALSCVAVWRGAWVLWDAAAGELGVGADGVASGVASHVGGAAALLCAGRASSVLAPPAKISILDDRPLAMRLLTHDRWRSTLARHTPWVLRAIAARR